MSNIPNNAVSSAFIPVQRAANDLIRARQVQSAKDHHHSEEVEELDDTAVNSVRDQQQRRGREGNAEGSPDKQEHGEEHVEIEALKSTPRKVAGKSKGGSAHLDISA